MRIIGGRLGKRRLNPPGKMPHTRPTTDFAKEGLFNILENNLDISSLKTLDLFGGTGSISFELASRGAEDLTVIEKDSRMYEFIRETASDFGLKGFRVYKSDVFKYISQCQEKFDFIFAGPPYALKNIEEIHVLVFEKKLLNPGGWFVLEHTPRNDFSGFHFFADKRNYGTTVFSVFVNKAAG